MNTSTNYGFNLPVGTDLVNLLTQLIPNWSNLDTILRNIQNDTFENATETVALGVHALTRLDPDAKLIKWVATANYTAGETFTVDGTPIAAATPSGNTLATGAYVTGAIVIAAINSDETAMTIYVTGTNVATDSERLGGELPAYYATASDMGTAQQDITDLDNLMGNTSISAIGDGTVTGAIDSLNNSSSTYIVGTEEKVGTFGSKDVYRKRYSASGLSATSTITVDATLTKANIDTLLSMESAIKDSTGDWFNGTYFTNSDVAYPKLNASGLQLLIAGETISAYFINIYYTKVTTP